MNPVPHASPLVSFGLPVRNGASTIGEAVESVLAQTLEDWELVISDNQSTDGTSEICRAYAESDARVRHVPTGRDLSIHDNFRAAFHHSHGTYFRWLGDDDWLEPQYAERTVTSLTHAPDAVLCTIVQQYYRNGSAVPVHDPVRALGNVSSPDPGHPGSRVAVPPGTRRARYRSCVLTRSTGRRRSNRASRVDPRRRLRLCMRDGAPGPFVHVPEVLAHRRFEAVSRIGISRNFLQREHAILCVARATSGLTTRSRLRVCAALAGFAAREHAHGARRRARAVRILTAPAVRDCPTSGATGHPDLPALGLTGRSCDV